MNPYRNVFGITGIIGSGKTTVCSLLEEKGARVIRADDLARAPLNPQYHQFPEIKKKISDLVVKNGGADIAGELFIDNLLNRKLLGEFVFSNENLTQSLNAIIHPEVKKLFEVELEHAMENQCRIIIYDVPLLFENKLEKQLKKTIVVYCPETMAIERASERMGLSRLDVKKRLERQISIEKKREMADYVVDNSGSFSDLKKEVEKLWVYLQDIR